MRHNRNIIEGVKDYLWGEGLDFWNTPRDQLHDFPLANPIQDLALNQVLRPGIGTAIGHSLAEKFLSGDYNHVSSNPVVGSRPRGYRPAVSTATYKSSGSSSRAYQQNGSPGGTRPSKKGATPMLSQKSINWNLRNGYSKAATAEHACGVGFDLKKIKGRWMCVRRRTRKK